MAVINSSNSSHHWWKQQSMVALAMASLPLPSANDGMVTTASNTAAKLRMATAIAAATIDWRCHCRQYHWVIVPSSHRHLHQQRLPSTRQQRPPSLHLPSTAASVDNDRHCCCWQWTMTTGFWRSLLSTVWQQRWRLSMGAIAVVIDGGSSGIEPMAPMAASSTAVVDGGSDNGAFTTASHKDDRHLCPLALTLALPQRRIGQQGGGRAVMHLICCCHGHRWWPHFLSPLAGGQSQGQRAWQQMRPSHQYPWPRRGGTPQTHWCGAKKSTTVTAMSPPLRLQTAMPMLPLLLLLFSSSRAVEAAAHYFELPCSINLVLPCSASGIKFPSFCWYIDTSLKKMILGTKNVTESQLRTCLVWPQ